MENPATWKSAEVVICDALEDHGRMTAAGAVGPSVPKFVADKLRSAGLLSDADEPAVGWQHLREHRAMRGYHGTDVPSGGAP